MDNSGDSWPAPRAWSGIKRHVETERFGPFLFQTGLDTEVLTLPLQRVQDAQERFRRSRLAHVAMDLEREVLASSIFGTNTIEGGELSEEETAAAMELSPEEIETIEQQRARNMRAAYDFALEQSQDPAWALSTEYIREIHRLVCHELPHDHNRPGLLRDNPKAQVTRVGNAKHGGVYKPPQNGRDVAMLLDALCNWHLQLGEAGCPAPVRAPLLHLYFELIHPFWDGNGRVGRVLEASILLNSGFRYAPFAMARFYLQHIHRYFALFNHCRKAADKKQPQPNQDFVSFHLAGLLEVINTLHDRVNEMVAHLLFLHQVRQALDDKHINQRQYAIVDFVLKAGRPVTLRKLREETWYRALYEKLTDKTRRRDLDRLRQHKLIQVDQHKQLWPGHIKSCLSQERRLF